MRPQTAIFHQPWGMPRLDKPCTSACAKHNCTLSSIAMDQTDRQANHNPASTCETKSSMHPILEGWFTWLMWQLQRMLFKRSSNNDWVESWRGAEEGQIKEELNAGKGRANCIGGKGRQKMGKQTKSRRGARTHANERRVGKCQKNCKLWTNRRWGKLNRVEIREQRQVK